MYELIIIGGGPAGVTAAIYAARKQLKTLFIAGEWGGQSNVSDDIQNWTGTPHISGTDLAKRFEEHVREYASDTFTIKVPETVSAIEKKEDGFEITLSDDTKEMSRVVFIATGSDRRKLPAKGADKYEHKGLTYCATCDGPLFADKDVVVVGGGNAGFETASQLLAYTKSVTLIEHGDTFRADALTVEKVQKNEKFTSLLNTDITEVRGEMLVNEIVYKNNKTNEEKTMPIEGIFVEIGMVPNTDLVAHLVDLNERKHIVVDPHTQKTSVDGIWAAGDCTDVLYHQNNIAAGDAVKAIESIFGYLR